MSASTVDETNGPATWATSVADSDFAAAESALTASIPVAWKAYLQRERWLSKGWLVSGTFVTLLSPTDAQGLMSAWDEALEDHPGFYPIGTDGSRNLYCLDLRSPELGVLLTDISSGGWDDAESLTLSVEEFVAQIDKGTFRPSPTA